MGDVMAKIAAGKSIAYKLSVPEGWTASAHEVLYLCVDLGRRKVAPWPEDVRAGLAAAATGRGAGRLSLTRRTS